MNTVGIYISFAVIVLILLVITFRISLWMARRALCQVISIFRNYDAVDYQRALPLQAIGLGPRPLFSFRFFRDYKPWALKSLSQAGVIRSGVEGSYYLSEETLDANEAIRTVCQIK